MWQGYKWKSPKADENRHQGWEELLGLVKPSLGSPKLTSAEIKQYNVATQVLGKVGGYEELVKSAASELTSDDKEACETLLAEYYILRTAVVCRERWNTVILC